MRKKLDEYKPTEKVAWTLQQSQCHKDQKKVGELFWINKEIATTCNACTH